MTAADLIPLALNLSLGLIVLSVGLRANFTDATYLLRNPGLLVRSVLSMNVIVPVIASIAMAILELDPALELAIIALALSPVPPVLPNKQTQAGGTEAYIVSLLVTMAVLSIVIIPLGVLILDWVFRRTAYISPVAILEIVGLGIILPLLLGIVVRRLDPLTERYARWVGLAGTALLILVLIPVFFQLWPLLADMISWKGTLLVLVIFSLCGIFVGHFLGGPVEDNRGVLALATATRHPGIAIAIAAAARPELQGAIAVVIWHLIVGGIVAGPYAKWRARVHKGSTPAK